MAEHAQPSRRWFHRHPALTLGGFSLLVILGMDALLGSALTAIGANPAIHGRDDAFRIQHDFLHHAFAPGVSAQAEWGPILYPVHTNSLGFKDSRPREVSLRSQGERILLMGDSFTEGIGVPWEDTFAGMLEARLARDRIEVLNAGVSSYSTILYLRNAEYLLNEVGLEFDHLIVFIDMSDILDDLLNYRFDSERRVVRDSDQSVLIRLDNFIERRTILLSSIRSLYERVRARARLAQPDPIVGAPSARWSMEEELWEAFGKPGLEVSTGHMNALHELLVARGVALTVVVYPWPDQVLNHDLESRQASHWREWASERDVGFVDLFPLFIDGSDPRESARRYFILGDVHWSRAGHALTAEAVYSALQR